MGRFFLQIKKLKWYFPHKLSAYVGLQNNNQILKLLLEVSLNLQ